MYQFFEDAGHGWLQVSHKELAELGLTDKISPYSYRDRKFAYLEEDCDLSLFVEAKGWTTLKGEYYETYHDNSPVREMEEY
jgi:hypothetical protein